MNKKTFSIIIVMAIFLIFGLFSAVVTLASDPGCTNGDCLTDPGCTNGDCSPPDPGCTNGDCPPDPGCTNGDCSLDQDNDNYTAQHDCDDNDASIHPFAPEICDGKDNNCNGFLGIGEEDIDGDGFLSCKNDCDDTNPEINPNAFELPGNLIDENCDGSLGDCDPNANWKNHGQFVRCVAHETDALIKAGALTQDEGDELISSAAKSNVGKK